MLDFDDLILARVHDVHLHVLVIILINFLAENFFLDNI